MPVNFSISKLMFKIVTLAIFGATIHICIILLMPHVSQRDAWGRLEETTKLNELSVLPDVSSNTRPMTFMAPDVRYATCRYDLTNGPLQLRSPLPNSLWSIALYSRHGENYYLISGRDVQSQAVNLLVVVDKTIDNEKQDEQIIVPGGKNSLKEITVSAPSTSGIIIIRAPVLNQAFADEVSTLLKQAFCRPVTFAQQASSDK